MGGSSNNSGGEGEKQVCLLYGSTGWIGGMLKVMCEERGVKVVSGKSRLENREGVKREVDEAEPSFVMCAAGVTGRPNVDWCESNKAETIRANVVGALNLCDVCEEKGVHLTYFGTGCIYQYDDDHPIGGKGFKEEDAPNFDGSFYSKTKAMVQEMMRNYTCLLLLRLRMPISGDLHARSFITKIIGYEKVINIPNSMTVLIDMLPLAMQLTQTRQKGVINFTNPGVISHSEVLSMYKEIVDPSFTWQTFTIEEQDKILKAKRSNNYLDTTRLEQLCPAVVPIHDAVRAAMMAIAGQQQ
uniref:NAD-dependent epimerase/dehydratase domain-containing protein n=1 Tax=Palpitomonas bilix TaxID=652834 RepID=A0A7S3GEB3_9EUKA|mmetsp:Transcript_45751/g.118249  ORF Transcript_45751/g.118249 Transcript_45751/m.118249 type:complete len:299 (+) Transcript_45751:40-936(+)